MRKELMLAFKIIAAIAAALEDGKVTADEAYNVAQIIITEVIGMFAKDGEQK